MNYKMMDMEMATAQSSSGGNINWVLIVVIVVTLILGVVCGILLGKRAMQKKDI